MFSLQLPSSITTTISTSFSLPKFNHHNSTLTPSLPSSLQVHHSLSYFFRRRHSLLPSRASQAKVGPTTLAEEVPMGLQRDAMPRHVAVIMDGNARWAKQRGLNGSAGHEAGVKALRQMVELCGKWGIRVLTVFAFSYENWARSKVSKFFLASSL